MSARKSFLLGDSQRICSIKLRPSCTASEEFAAYELRRYLRRMTGQPIVDRRCDGGGSIYLNHREFAEQAGIDVKGLDLHGDAFHLRVVGDALFLFSANDRGILYAAYELLRRLGVRWYTPVIERVPDLQEARLPIPTETVCPAFEYRDTIGRDMEDPLWLVRNRLNGHFCGIPDYLGGNQVYGMHVHTYFTLVRPDTHFKSHPEYFSLVKGERTLVGGQLCLSNPEVKEIAVNSVLSAIQKNPRSSIFSVSQNDWSGACECPECQKLVDRTGTQAGPVVLFANAVAEAVAATHPNILISTLAYHYTVDAPKQLTVHPNVRIRLCPIGCCQGHPFGTCEDPVSKQFLTAFKKWSKLTSQIFIWHYAINFSHSYLPMPNFDELSGNLKFYGNHGVVGVFVQDMGETGFGSESADLRCYLVASLLWNPKQDVWALVQEWVEAVHGEKAAVHVMQYYRLFHDTVREHRDMHPHCYDDTNHPLYSTDLVAQADAALAQGAKVARGFSKQRINVLRAGLKMIHIDNAGGLYRLKGNCYQGEATAKDLRELKQIAKTWKDYGITHPGEGAKLEKYISNVRAKLASHPIQRIRDKAQSVVAVPVLGGRLVAWEALGRQWLAAPDPFNKYQRYPCSGGYSELAAINVHIFLGWNDVYEVVRADARRIEEKTSVGSWNVTALEMSRRHAFKDGALVTRSQVANRSDKASDFQWGASLQLALTDWSAIEIESAAGLQTLQHKDCPDGLQHAQRVMAGAEGGTWRILGPDYRITGVFDALVTSLLIGTNRSQGLLALDLRSERICLKAGEKIETLQTVKIEKIDLST